MAWMRWAKLGLAIVLAQAFYWVILSEVFSFEDIQSRDVSLSEVARIDAPTLAAAQTADFETVDMPYTYCCEDNYHAVRFTFELDDVPEEGVGVRPLGQVDNYVLYANGSRIHGDGIMEQGRQTFHGQRRQIHLLPSGILRNGENSLLFITVRSGAYYTDFKAPQVNRHDILERETGKRNFLIGEYRYILGAIMAVLGMFALLVAWRSRESRFALWLAVLSFSWVGYVMATLWYDPPFGASGRQLFYFTQANLVPVAVLGFLDEWTGRRVRYLQPGLIVSYLIVMALIALFLTTGAMPERFEHAGILTDWFARGLTLIAVVRLGYHLWRQPEDRLVETGVLSVLIVALGLSAWVRLAGPFAHAAPFFILALAAAFLHRNFRLFRSREQLNAELETQLVERTAELEEAHSREKLFLREQAHQDERRRIMRDMHDGMGSNLMSMLLAARRGKVEAGSIARGLQTVIDEMRLMIDSMDSVGESLGSALVLFRERAQARVTDAGYAFEWDDESGGNLPELDARPVLQVFRILQEAITNALKHTDGDTIRVAVRSDELRVSDNGSRFEGPRHGGRGLDNMEARANSIGGSFAISHENGETVARIGLPQSAETE